MTTHSLPPGQTPLVAIAGPTAVGKSAIALLLAERLGGEIISVDSMQVYRGMDIGTAKPSADDRGRAPHHLLDIRDVSESFDAAQFLQLARAAIDDIRQRGRTPILCGGTGLYFKALACGLSEAPPADPDLRDALRALPLPELLRELAERDPATYERIDRQNPRRVIRAVEIVRLTGKPVEQRVAWTRPGPAGERPSEAEVWVGLARAPGDLHRRIDQRVDEMFQRGLVEETRRLIAAGLGDNPVALQALGYRQVFEHLQGARPLPETVQLVKIRTRQYARRQMTWFRRQLPVRWVRIEADEPAGHTAKTIAEMCTRSAP